MPLPPTYNADDSPTRWVARTGFTMFWLGNLAEPAGQLSANNLVSDEIGTGISTGASTFLYGLNLGLEASW